MGSIPGPESTILLAVGQLSPWVLEPVSHNERSCKLQLRPQGKQKQINITGGEKGPLSCGSPHRSPRGRVGSARLTLPITQERPLPNRYTHPPHSPAAGKCYSCASPPSQLQAATPHLIKAPFLQFLAQDFANPGQASHWLLPHGLCHEVSVLLGGCHLDQA